MPDTNAGRATEVRKLYRPNMRSPFLNVFRRICSKRPRRSSSRRQPWEPIQQPTIDLNIQAAPPTSRTRPKLSFPLPGKRPACDEAGVTEPWNTRSRDGDQHKQRQMLSDLDARSTHANQIAQVKL
jgi:hypothetical protein